MIYTEYGEEYDIKYSLLVPPFGPDYSKMTPQEAKEYFDWFLSTMPSRLEYLRQRCSDDLKIPVSTLDFSPASLVPIWRWFIEIAHIVPTPESELEKMEAGAKIFGESFINRYQFSVVSKFIMRDIGMYWGETFIHNYPQLYWSFFTKPKSMVGVNQPHIFGFSVGGVEYNINPLAVPAVRAGVKFFSNEQSETDIYDFYMHWAQYAPVEDKKSACCLQEKL